SVGHPCGPEAPLVRPAAAALLLRGARSDAARPPGPRPRPELPLGDLLLVPRARAGGARLREAAPRGEGFLLPDRDEDRAAEGVLPRRGLPPGLPDRTPESAVHRVQRPAEDRGAEAGVPGDVSGGGGAGDQLNGANAQGQAAYGGGPSGPSERSCSDV